MNILFALLMASAAAIASPMPPERDVVSVGIDAGGLWYLPKGETREERKCVAGFHLAQGIWCYRDRRVEVPEEVRRPAGQEPQVICVRDGYARDCSKNDAPEEDE